MGLRGEAAIVGFVELAPERKPTRPPMLTLEQWARLAKSAIDDAGLHPRSVNGFVTSGIAESSMFVPATLSEYLGLPINFGEVVDLGGATSAGMVWRAAAAIELGLCDAVLCIAPGLQFSGARTSPGRRSGPPRPPAISVPPPTSSVRPRPSSRSLMGIWDRTPPTPRSPGATPRSTATTSGPRQRSAADQRTNACATPDAVFYGQPITVDDVLASPMVADPLHKLEMVMPCSGGAGVLVANAELAAQSKNRPVWVKGFGEHLSYKTPTYAEDLLHSPIGKAADLAFAMSGLGRGDVDMASVYDCYTITVLMSLEDAGFCAKGEGMEFVRCARPDLPGRLPSQHGRWPALLRPSRDGRRHAPRLRRHPPADGPGRGGAGR